MKVTGPLTHARFAAELSRIIRISSKWAAHETLRLHTGEHQPQDLVNDKDIDSYTKEVMLIITDIIK